MPVRPIASKAQSKIMLSNLNIYPFRIFNNIPDGWVSGMKPPPWLFGSVTAWGSALELECVTFARTFFNFWFCCHARTEHSSDSDLPVPVGDSSSAWQWPSRCDRSSVEITRFMNDSWVPYGWYGNSTGTPPMWILFIELRLDLGIKLGSGFIDAVVDGVGRDWEGESTIFTHLRCLCVKEGTGTARFLSDEMRQRAGEFSECGGKDSFYFIIFCKKWFKYTNII